VVPLEDLYDLLRDHYDKLPAKQRQVADVILSSPRASSYSTVAELAVAAGVTNATVVRLCQSLGFTGYSQLRGRLRGPRTLEHLWPLDLLGRAESLAGEGLARASLRQDVTNLEQLFAPEFEAALTTVVAAIAAARRVLVISAGSHAATGLVLTHNLNFMGRPAELENRGGSYLGQALSVLTPADLVVTVVFWHVQREVHDAVQWCREQGIPTLAITDSPLSPPARVATHVLVVPAEGASFFRSQTAAVAAINALLAQLTTVDRDHTLAAMGRAQSIWGRLGIYDGTRAT